MSLRLTTTRSLRNSLPVRIYTQSPLQRAHFSQVLGKAQPRLSIPHGFKPIQRYRRSHAIRHSAFSWSSIAIYIVAGLSTGIVYGIYRGYKQETGATENPDSAWGEYDNMAAPIPRGRPGNLTPEEEDKLREMWQLMLQVTGVIEPPSAPATPNGKSPNLSRTTSHTSSGEKKKKSRMSFLRKKDKKEEDEHQPEPARSVPNGAFGGVQSVADGLKDDKHNTAGAFKDALASSTPAQIRQAFWNMVKHDHPDALLLRFLRARKWDVSAAFVMAISALHWRLVEAHVDSDIMPNGEAGMLEWASQPGDKKSKEGADFLSQIRAGKSFLHGTDKAGRPICYVRARLHHPGQESEESLERFTVFTIETARLLLRPPVDTATIVFDMTGFGMNNMDYVPVKFMIKCFEANYPESLGVVLVHNAPWVFQGIWRLIRGWLDPVVAGKIHFTSNLKDMEEFIDKGAIIKELGGPVNWQYHYIEPQQGENASMQDTATKEKLLAERTDLSREYEAIVQDWIASADPSSRPSTAATNPSDSLRQRRNEIAAKLRRNYWKLDPYVRARSVYDRTGDLKAEDAGSTVPALDGKVSEPNSGRPSVDSVAQSFYTSRTSWGKDDEVD